MDPTIADALLAWLGTYWIHSTVTLAGVWAFEQLRTTPSLSLRETLWRVGLLAPIATATLQMTDLVDPAFGSLEVAEAIVVPRTVGLDEPTSDFGRNLDGPKWRSAESHSKSGFSWSTLVVLLWLTGAAVSLLRIVAAMVGLRRALLDRETVVDGPILERANHIAIVGGLSRTPRISLSNRTTGPLSLPSGEVCLPSAIESELTVAQLDSALAHEFAHTLRHDAMWMLLVTVVQSVFFFQPFSSVARRRLADIAEICADSWAAETTKDRRSLAECLEIFATAMSGRSHRMTAAGISSHGSGLLLRVQLLLDHTVKHSEVPMRTKAAIAALSMSLSVVIPGINAQEGDGAGRGGGAAVRDSETVTGSQNVITNTRPANAEPIVDAVRRGDRGRAEHLLLNGSSADAVSSAGESLLRIAISQSDESMVELLLEAGADPNAGDANGDRPLHVAARENLISIFELLLEAGADKDARNAAGKTPSQETAADELHELLGEARARR